MHNRSRAATLHYALLGFTLLELMMVLGVMAILLLISAPSLQKTVAEYRLNMTLETFSHQIAIARNSAIIRHRKVLMCALDARGQCQLSKERPIIWHYGWQLCTPMDDALLPVTSSELIDQCSPTNEGKTVHVLSRRILPKPVSVQITGNQPYLLFNTLGLLAHFGGTFSFCSVQKPSVGHTLIINAVGRVRKKAGADCA